MQDRSGALPGAKIEWLGRGRSKRAGAHARQASPSRPAVVHLLGMATPFPVGSCGVLHFLSHRVEEPQKRWVVD